ncbi:MAG: hypothetical protein SFY92_01590 [Verrucomicrobiae bacterium]|nr:hypothetical protein [Verrucomicrobiae bacterium]
MLISILIRRLRPGVTFEQFQAAWMADPGHFGTTIKVTHARRIDDDREVVSYAVMDMSRDDLHKILNRTEAGERTRHDRIDGMIESTVIKGIYEILDEVDLT